jgi:hypothetical protein
MDYCGKIVKISRNGERFWLVDVMKDDDGHYFGRVNNHLVRLHPYKENDIIKFHGDEVLDVWTPEH